MKPTYAHELSERALKNYEILAKLEEDGKKNIYTTTALISAMIFSIISFNEKVFRELSNKQLPPEIRTWEWPNEVRQYLNSDSKFILFLNSLRNSVAHSDFQFIVEGETNVVKGASFSIEMDNKRPTIDFFETDLLNLLKNLTKTYKFYKIPSAARYL